ncbi:MAG TPA: helix-turn-helix domain-containing protein [Mycobacteriales bacterium]
MTDRHVKSRGYDNSARAEQARLLRRKVIDAAHEAMLEDGWSGTTIAKVAARAGVSAETVYKRFGGKAGLLKAVYDVRMAGDDEPIPIAERPAMRAMAAEPDPRRVAEHYASLGREFMERAGPLVSVLLGVRDADPELAAFMATIDAERLIGASGFVRVMASRATLRVDPEQARDIVWALISPDLYDLFITRRGWSLDAYQDWLAQSLASIVESGPAGSSSGKRQKGRAP